MSSLTDQILHSCCLESWLIPLVFLEWRNFSLHVREKKCRPTWGTKLSLHLLAVLFVCSDPPSILLLWPIWTPSRDFLPSDFLWMGNACKRRKGGRMGAQPPWRSTVSMEDHFLPGGSSWILPASLNHKGHRSRQVTLFTQSSLSPFQCHYVYCPGTLVSSLLASLGFLIPNGYLYYTVFNKPLLQVY